MTYSMDSFFGMNSRGTPSRHSVQCTLHFIIGVYLSFNPYRQNTFAVLAVHHINKS